MVVENGIQHTWCAQMIEKQMDRFCTIDIDTVA